MYVPYVGGEPASVSINGHRMLILSQHEDVLENSLGLFGADHLQEVNIGETSEEQDFALDQLASSAEAGVVVAPLDIEIQEVIRNLELELPWIH